MFKERGTHFLSKIRKIETFSICVYKKTYEYYRLDILDTRIIFSSLIGDYLTRVYAEKNTWKRVYQDLKSRGFSLAKINGKIGTQIQRQLYQGYGIDKKSFARLQQLVDFPIPTIPNPFWNEQVVLEKDEKLAEMIGIILGFYYF